MRKAEQMTLFCLTPFNQEEEHRHDEYNIVDGISLDQPKRSCSKKQTEINQIDQFGCLNLSVTEDGTCIDLIECSRYWLFGFLQFWLFCLVFH